MYEDITYLAIFLAVLLESIVIVGLFFPGVMIVASAAFLASAGRLDLFLVFTAAWIGMLIGDNIGYAMGRFGLYRIKPLERYLTKIRPKLEDSIEKHSRLVVFYQFVGFARAPVPLLLGAIKHPLKKWFLLVIVATTVFISSLVLMSYVVGSFLGKDKALAAALVIQIISAVILVAIIIKILHKRYYKNK